MKPLQTSHRGDAEGAAEGREVMRFLSVCSGIEAASVAWQPLGWKAVAFAEIEPFPSAVLAHHYPDVPNLGDMTKLPKRILLGEVEVPDVFCGGTPCQTFSVAGLRRSLDDERGNLSLTFCEIANAIDTIRAQRGMQPCIVFWENVPGVLNTKDNAFGCFLAGLAGEDDPLQPPGGKWANAGAVFGPKRAVAWRVLDAQYFGVAQRRRRVFVVASARDGFDPAAVLFEWDGVRRDTAPSRDAGKVASTIPARSTGGGGMGTDLDCAGGLIPALSQCITTGTGQRYDPETETILPVTHTLRGEGFDASEDGTGRGTPLVPVAYGVRTANTSSSGWGIQEECTHTLDCAQGVAVAQPVTFDLAQITSAANRSRAEGGLPASTMSKGSNMHVATAMQVRRLTPMECERLQGFPDGYTQIPWRKKPADQCPDGPRYKALGNSWAVPVVRWIGKRIEQQMRGRRND